MEQETVVLLALMIVFCIVFVSYLLWQIRSDIIFKRLAKNLRHSTTPRPIKVIEIERSRAGIAKIIIEFTCDNGCKLRKVFRPRSLLTEISALSVEEGAEGALYATDLKPGAAAWLEFQDNSFWGCMGL